VAEAPRTMKSPRDAHTRFHMWEVEFARARRGWEASAVSLVLLLEQVICQNGGWLSRRGEINGQGN
jgi:hypothetical protein